MSLAQRIQAIDALLPQTQCGKCGHPGCLPYAEGILQGEAINKCPPGGQETILALSGLLQRPALPLEAESGPIPPQVAVIREAECIGCTKCIQACPVDAIVGAARLMHSVISDECSGCELCIAPCPVDCIDIVPLDELQAQRQRNRANQFRQRYQARQQRLQRDDQRRQAERAARLGRSPSAVEIAQPPQDPAQAAVARVRAQQQAGNQADARHKRLKIEANMAQVALAKAEKQLAMRPSPQLATQVEHLRAHAEQARLALEAVPATSATLSGNGVLALKQAKIAYATCRTALVNGERRQLPAEQLELLRRHLHTAEQHLHQAEAQSGKPLPNLVRQEKRPVDPQLRALKTELAYARADLSRLQRREDTDPQQLEQARLRFEQLQQRLLATQPPAAS